MTPIEKSPNRHVPEFSFLFPLIPFIDPESPATPSSKNNIEDKYSAIRDPVTALWLAALIIYFFSTCT